MTTTEKLERIKAKCQEIIALGEKRTQGEWIVSSSIMVCDTEAKIISSTLTFESTVGITMEEAIRNASFIAACAGPAEAMAKSTIAAIDELLWQSSGSRLGDTGRNRASETLNTILSAWPDELLL